MPEKGHTMKKTFTCILASTYMGAGLFGGLLIQQAIPAMNALGVLVHALLWPAFIYCAPTSRGCSPLDIFPEWALAMMFSI